MGEKQVLADRRQWKPSADAPQWAPTQALPRSFSVPPSDVEDARAAAALASALLTDVPLEEP